MPQTYTPIQSTTLTSNQTSITFSNISGSYTDLILVFNGKSSGSANSLSVQFNGDTGSNYSETVVYGTGSAAGSAKDTNLAFNILGNVYSTDTVNIANFMNYSNSSTYKSTLARGNNAGSQIAAWVNLWQSTSAITSMILKLDNGAANFTAGSTFTLYGVKSA